MWSMRGEPSAGSRSPGSSKRNISRRPVCRSKNSPDSPNSSARNSATGSPSPSTSRANVRAASRSATMTPMWSKRMGREPTCPTARSARELRLALLVERGDGLRVLGRFPARADHLALAGLDRVEVGLGGVARQQLLDHAQLRARVAGDLAGEGERVVDQGVRDRQLVGEPDRARRVAVVEPAGEAHLARLAEADALGE